ncbi:Acyl-CoA-binding domain-containing protein 1 [Turnera subulata]|uniref:Acyl-CoA-binding domain-containing protein 1 n=1 Tax=Turnera subulata TaxID=218843 RepID=A0A9Q0FDM4_9ROSI|nr:Acyl-CoA-binding domain-containing protein 1 [Turnera subulata]
MAEWQQLLQSIVLGLIFSYLLAKLISVVVSFRDDNLSLTRHPATDAPSRSRAAAAADDDAAAALLQQEVEGSTIAEQGSVRSVSESGDDDDDWEGVESTELDEEFSAATAFVAAAAADRVSHKVSSDLQLQLYGLYKIATEGPCSSPAPSALKMTARAKWNAWQKLGAMPTEDAMQKYIDIVTELYPTWASGSAKRRDRDVDSRGGNAQGPMGPVFSTFVYEEESGNELKMDALHAFAREGDADNLLKCINDGVSVDVKDSEGRTPLHWAVDRGHFNIVESLVGKNADINAKDNEGQTPLHYAAVCEREGIAEFLVKHNADTHIKDNDGIAASDLCELNWACLQQAATD